MLKVEIFSRQAFFSKASAHKKRPEKFCRKICFENLLSTTDFSLANLTVLFDSAKGSLSDHFLRETNVNVVEFHGGTEALSFLFMIDYVTKLPLDPNTILYFVEDDYLHLPGWTQILLEGFSLPGVDYVTLYDHKDKYFLYPKLESKIFATRSSHWRTTPSTTHTFATRLQTLKEDLPIHRKYSEGREISQDHAKFLKLQKKKKRVLVSSIPGASTHVEPEFASPCTDWDLFFIKE
jgi:hypothetical protein